MKKRLISGLTAFAMAVSMVGLPAVGDLGLHFDIVASAATVSNGNFGQNLKWRLDSSGVLTISGTGQMPPFSYYGFSNGVFGSTAPWYSYNDNIKSVVISEGITHIGQISFTNCHNLTEVTLPNSLTSIGRLAFGACTKLSSIVIPDNVTDIEDAAFSGCENLKSVTMSKNISFIGSYTFNGTYWLKDKKEENPLVVVKNILIDGTSLSGDVIIPDGVTSICGRAFENCNELTSVSIPNSTNNIGEGAFLGCEEIKSITIPKNVTNIGDYAFGYIMNDGYTKIDEFSIYCYKDTVGEKYAIDNGFEYFVLADNNNDYTEVRNNAIGVVLGKTKYVSFKYSIEDQNNSDEELNGIHFSYDPADFTINSNYIKSSDKKNALFMLDITPKKVGSYTISALSGTDAKVKDIQINVEPELVLPGATTGNMYNHYANLTVNCDGDEEVVTKEVKFNVNIDDANAEYLDSFMKSIKVSRLETGELTAPASFETSYTIADDGKSAEFVVSVSCSRSDITDYISVKTSAQEKILKVTRDLNSQGSNHYDKIVTSNVTNHIEYIEKNGNLIYDYQNSDIYKKVRNLAINDKEVSNYDKMKITKYLWDELSNKGLIGALNISSIEELDEMFENITDSELMAQIIVTELISSAELKAKFVSDGINGINIADDRLLYLLYLNKSLFSMSETDKENIEKLLEMEDKSSKDYISARNLLLNKYFSSDLELSKSDIEATDIVGLITDYDDIDDEYGFIKNGTDPELFDFYDGLKILQFSIDEVSKSNANANDIRVFYENVFALSSLSYSTQETLEVLKQSVEKMKDTDSNGDILLSKYETAIIEYIDELQNAISGHYQDYFNKKVSERLEEMNNDLVDFIVSEALDKVLMITCCPLAWVANSIPGITLDILMVTYGCFTGASERVSEIKYIYATSVVYEALANEFRNKNGTYGYFPKKLITNKTEYSVDLYETGLLWYKVAADMYAEHCAKYLMMTLNPLGSKQVFEDTLKDIKTIEDWFINVNNIKCHENSVIAVNPASKEKLYVISCPVDVAVISNGTVLAEVKDETLYKYVNDPRIRIATFINDNYDGFSKALIVPYDYDVKIAGYDDGKMNLTKVVIVPPIKPCRNQAA